ncbi:MAG: tRNA uridine-5-carboxymethylaminomethyl(34) synthesis GTPase MnmE [Mogibacterium sp.]|nr:tRNA uridine-5-carboxymethylaminomethyl(34) synthesis GTPase MnmE [Mogibacterium sp.]
MADTIAAISTPAGSGGIGIVKVSGPQSLDIMRTVMKDCPETVRPRHAYYGNVISQKSGDVIDEAIFIYMKAPHTYTREDVLEIQAHGSLVAIRSILREVLAAGARLAEPGEFTKLAFLNGRIDLAQAEAVIDLINAKSEIPERIAVGQLGGRLSREVKSLRVTLVDVLAEMAVNIDFPDEDIEEFTLEKFAGVLDDVQQKVDRLLSTADRGRIAREGLKIAIVGKPNVGKSSLMNGLLGQDRVIVTAVPGTTRDTVEEAVSIGGMPVVLVDTAGMHESDDVVESIGISRSREAIEIADMILFVVDGSKPLEDEDQEVGRLIVETSGGRYGLAGSSMHPFGSKRVVAVLNKRDLGIEVTAADVCRTLGLSAEEPPADLGIVSTSLLIPGGADAVREQILNMLERGDLLAEHGNTVTNERHRQALIRANASLLEAIDLLNRREPLEIAEVETRAAYEKLGEIIGESAGEEILDAVFSRFCLGK